jgi:predicted ester cyclase
MLSEEPKTVLRCSTAAFNARAWPTYYAHVADSYVVHGLPRGTLPGPASLRQRQLPLLAAFPDLQMTHDDEIAEGDKVVVRATATGTHQGTFMGIAPTGKRVRWSIMSIHRIVGGQLAEAWGEVDRLGLLRQLAARPGSGPDGPGQAAHAVLTAGAMTDLVCTVEDQITEADRVASRVTFSFIHNGPLLGVPATGMRVTSTGITLDRLVGHTVVETWAVEDVFGILQQLGAWAAPALA